MAAKHTRRMPRDEFEALIVKVIEAGRLIESRPPFTNFTMLTGDFEVTQIMGEARFIAFDNSMDCGLFIVNQIGEAVRIIPTDD